MAAESQLTNMLKYILEIKRQFSPESLRQFSPEYLNNQSINVFSDAQSFQNLIVQSSVSREVAQALELKEFNEFEEKLATSQGEKFISALTKIQTKVKDYESSSFFPFRLLLCIWPIGPFLVARFIRQEIESLPNLSFMQLSSTKLEIIKNLLNQTDQCPTKITEKIMTEFKNVLNKPSNEILDQTNAQPGQPASEFAQKNVDGQFSLPQGQENQCPKGLPANSGRVTDSKNRH